MKFLVTGGAGIIGQRSTAVDGARPRAAGPPHRRPLRPAFADWRPGDQPIFVADVTRASEALGWRPRTRVADGVQKLAGWIQENRALFA